jgi:hypothetical protein
MTHAQQLDFGFESGGLGNIIARLDEELTTVDRDQIITDYDDSVTQMRELSTRPKGWQCYQDYCEPTLRNRTCSCLCHCRHHQDKCPIHS